MAVAKKGMGSSTSLGIWKVKGSIFFLFFSLSLCNSTSSLELGPRSARIEIGSGLGSGVERPWTNYSRSRHYDYRRDDLWTRSMGMTLPLCAGSTYVSWFRGVSRERSLVRFLFLLFYIFSTIHLANLNKCFLQYRSILNRKSTWNNFLTPRVKKRSPIKRNERFIRFVDCVQGRVVSANRRSRVNKSSRIIPLGVGGPVTGSAILWNLTVREQRCTRFEAHRLVRRWMVLDVIAREITRRFQRALSRHLLLFPPPSFTLHRSPSPLHTRTTQPFFSGGAPLYTRLSSPPLRTKRLSRNPRSFPALFYEQPLWHRREPALISHLPLFFISDIRIYHRDPAATPLEGQREEERERKGWRRIEGHGGRGRIALKKDGEAHRRLSVGWGCLDRWRLSTPIHPDDVNGSRPFPFRIMPSFSICPYLLLLLRDGESCTAVQARYDFIHPDYGWIDESIRSFLRVVLLRSLPIFRMDLNWNNLLLFFFKTLSRSSLLIIRATNVDIFMIYL